MLSKSDIGELMLSKFYIGELMLSKSCNIIVVNV